MDEAFFAHLAGAAVEVGEGQAVDLWRKGAEAFFEEGKFAGHRKCEIGAAMISPLKDNNAGATSVSARDFDRCLDCFGAAVEQHALFGMAAWGHGVEQLGDFDIDFIGGHNRTGVDHRLRLRLNRGDNGGMIVAQRLHANPAGKVEQGIAIDIGDRRTQRRGDGDGGEFGGTACRCGLAPRNNRPALGAGDFGDKVDGRHRDLAVWWLVIAGWQLVISGV